MPKVRILAPTTDKEGKPLAAGQEVDVDEETFTRLRQSGTASAVEDEEAQAKAAEEGGSYTARMTRGAAGEGESTEPPAEESPAPKKKA